MNAHLKVVLIEDNRGDVYLVRIALKEHHIDHELVVLPDGACAKAYIDKIGASPEAPCPDLILLDLNLPRATGHEVLAYFRAHPLCRNTPVIIVTSSDAPTDRSRAQELGVARYFRKPTEIDGFLQLGAVVKEVMSV